MTIRLNPIAVLKVAIFCTFLCFANQIAVAAETNAISEQLERRSFAIGWATLLRGLQTVTDTDFTNANHSCEEIKLATLAFFKKAGVDLTAPNRGIFLPEIQDYIEVKATPSELGIIKRTVDALNKDFPQIYFKARFIKVSESSIRFILQSGMAASTNEIATTEIIPAEKLKPVLRGIYDNYHYLTYAELENVTTSGQSVQRNCDDLYIPFCETNCAIEVVPKLSADGFTLNLKATVSKPEKLAAQANIWDGQTLAIIPPTSDGTNRLVVFVTVKLVDPNGLWVHSNEELILREQKMATTVPPQE